MKKYMPCDNKCPSCGEVIESDEYVDGDEFLCECGAEVIVIALGDSMGMIERGLINDDIDDFDRMDDELDLDLDNPHDVD